MKSEATCRAVIGGCAANPAMCGLIMALAGMAAACSSSSPGTDSGNDATADSTSAEASSRDTSVADRVGDAAQTDASTPDTSMTDASAPETAAIDAATDARSADAATSDTSTPDALAPDATDAALADASTNRDADAANDASVTCGNPPYVPTNVTASAELVQAQVTIAPDICPGSTVVVPSDGRTKATIGLPAGTNFYLKGTAPGLLPGLSPEFNFSQQLVGLDSGAIDLPLTFVTVWAPLAVATVDPQFSALGCQEVFPEAGAPPNGWEAGVNCDAGPSDAAAITHGLVFASAATQQGDAGACRAAGGTFSVQGLTLGAAADYTVVYADSSGVLNPSATSIGAAHPLAMIIINDAAAHPLVQIRAANTGCSSSTTVLPSIGSYFMTGMTPVLPGAVTSVAVFLAP
ncbi:MAG: hypothetical protein M3O50_14325 [Myxococcota bacterium]|nr:hypothetical protein [Myxococcota bacterium]